MREAVVGLVASCATYVLGFMVSAGTLGITAFLGAVIAESVG